MIGRGANPELKSPGPDARPAPGPTSPGSARCAGELDGVGQHGMLALGFERVGRRTMLTERRFRLPLQVLEPLDLDGSGAATVMVLNPTGGVLGGDGLEASVRLDPGSHVCLTTPAATRVYQTVGPRATQTLAVSVGADAVLECVPDHLIPSPGARLRPWSEFALAPGTTA